MSLFTTLLPALHRASAHAEASSVPRPVVRPAYEIQEKPDAWGLTVFLPGVAKDGLEITAEDGRLRITGRRAWQRPEAWTPVHRETTDAAYELVLSYDNAIDAGQIAAELREGVLHVSLPKQEALKPRRIAVA